MKDITLKTSPPPPADRAVYGPEVLNQVPFFPDRAAYEAFTGQQAPPFDISRPAKRWYFTGIDGVPTSDTSVKSIWKYTAYDTAEETPGLRQYAIPANELATVNFPGPYRYDAYDPKPSGVFYMLNGERQYIDKWELSTPDEARQTAQALTKAGYLGPDGAPAVEVAVNERAGMFAFGYDANEERRVHVLRTSVGNYNVGALLVKRHKAGFNSTGWWGDAEDYPEPHWISSKRVDQPVGENAFEYPVPQRALLPTERWKRLPFGLQIFNVLHPDGAAEMQEETMPAAIAAINAKLDRIMKFFSIS